MNKTESLLGSSVGAQDWRILRSSQSICGFLRKSAGILLRILYRTRWYRNIFAKNTTL